MKCKEVFQGYTTVLLDKSRIHVLNSICFLTFFKIISIAHILFPVLFLHREISDSIRLGFHLFKRVVDINSFIQFILDSSNLQLEVQIVMILSSRSS